MPWGGRAGEFYPQVSVSEDEKQIKVQAEIPGMNEKDIEINYEPGYLTLRGEKKEEEQRKSESGQVQFSECRYGSFERRIPLRREIQQDQIQASYDRGVLTISLPKTEEARASAKRIPIRAGGEQQQVESSSSRGARKQQGGEGAAAH
jgi:HSP20 family protein